MFFRKTPTVTEHETRDLGAQLMGYIDACRSKRSDQIVLMGMVLERMQKEMSIVLDDLRIYRATLAEFAKYAEKIKLAALAVEKRASAIKDDPGLVQAHYNCAHDLGYVAMPLACADITLAAGVANALNPFLREMLPSEVQTLLATAPDPTPEQAKFISDLIGKLKTKTVTAQPDRRAG
jgi:hypothetical protein